MFFRYQSSEHKILHLRSACVDLSGDLIAEGIMAFPPDDTNEFAPLELHQLRVSRGEIMTLTACTGVRDGSGFYDTVAIGAKLFLPEPLAVIVSKALRSGATELITASLPYQTGSLRFHSTRSMEQPLSDWHLRIEDVAGDIRVEISAALHANQLREWKTAEQNYWRKQSGCRIEVRLCVDASTRAACFKAYIPDADSDEQGAPLAVLGELGATRLDLASAPLSWHSLFGIRDGRWVKVSFGSGKYPTMALTEHRDVKRLPNGFLSDGSYVWPRLWFSSIDMEAIILGVGKLPIHLSGIETLVHGGYEGTMERASLATLAVSLTIEGLVLVYALEKYQGQVVIPWEALILRYPMLATRRRNLLSKT